MSSPMPDPRTKAPAEAVPPILATIVATIGPASESPEVVRRLIQAGVSVFRFNFSHGDFAAHERRLRVVRDAAEQLKVTVACLGDLQGPKIRVGKIPAGVGGVSPSGGGLIEVVSGQDVVFKCGIAAAYMRDGASGPEPVLPVTYEALVREVQPGHRVLINDGAIRMLAVDSDVALGELRCRVTVGGMISSGKGINVPQSELSAAAVTERDWECVGWAVEHGLDFLALSFVRRAEEVVELKERMAAMCAARFGNAAASAWTPVVAKIEMPQAVEDLERIVSVSDAVMVARGDLGVEMDIARVPVVQKQIVAECAKQGKPCIVATQMLESMIDNASPTRAEASDVANAIFDGADALMLSAETATGKHPALVVETMARIISAAEQRLRDTAFRVAPPSNLVAAHRGTAALARGAWAIAQDIGAAAVVCWSENGGTARYLSQNRFHIAIVAYTSSARSARQMALMRGVTSVCSAPPGSGSLSEWNAAVDEHLLSRGITKKGDAIVLLAGRPLGRAKATNTVAIHRVGDATGGYSGHTGAV